VNNDYARRRSPISQSGSPYAMSMNTWTGRERAGSEHGMGPKRCRASGFQRHRSGRSPSRVAHELRSSIQRQFQRCSTVSYARIRRSGVQSTFHVSAHARSVGPALSLDESEPDALRSITAGLVFLPWTAGQVRVVCNASEWRSNRSGPRLRSAVSRVP
jgi:hypothetical protein